MSETKTCGSCKYGGLSAAPWLNGYRICEYPLPSPCNSAGDLHTHKDSEPCPLWETKEAPGYFPSDGPFFAQEVHSGLWEVADAFARRLLISPAGAKKIVDALNAACREWAQQNAAPGWIPCSERMPGDGGRVLARLIWGSITIAVWYESEGLWTIADVEGRQTRACVTHWMPLPAFPQ